MSRTALLWLTTVACLTLAAGGGAMADDLGHDGARALVELKRILPLEEILKRNEAILAGRIIELELERKKDRFFYKIRLLKPDGVVSRLRLDAETGVVLAGR